MTSISALSSATYQSPLQKLEAELQSEVDSGTISSSDHSALSQALTDIDSALKSGASTDQTSGTTPPSPGDMQSKIDSLIQNEVSSGKLTSDQATELKGIFKAAFSHGPGGAGGPPAGDADGTSTTGSTSSDGSSSSSGTNNIAALLQQFLQALQSTLSNSSSNTYNATGSTSTSDSVSSLSAVLIDYRT